MPRCTLPSNLLLDIDVAKRLAGTASLYRQLADILNGVFFNQGAANAPLPGNESRGWSVPNVLLGAFPLQIHIDVGETLSTAYRGDLLHLFNGSSYTPCTIRTPASLQDVAGKSRPPVSVCALPQQLLAGIVVFSRKTLPTALLCQVAHLFDHVCLSESTRSHPRSRSRKHTHSSPNGRLQGACSFENSGLCLLWNHMQSPGASSPSPASTWHIETRNTITRHWTELHCYLGKWIWNKIVTSAATHAAAIISRSERRISYLFGLLTPVLRLFLIGMIESQDARCLRAN